MIRLMIQRLLANGERTLPNVCIVDIGAISRWIRDIVSVDVNTEWTTIREAITKSNRRMIWIAGMPGPRSRVFDSAELANAVQHLQFIGEKGIILSEESVTSLLSLESKVVVSGATAVITAQVEEYPEQLYVLDSKVVAVFDIGTGVVHTYFNQYNSRKGEPRFIPMIHAAVRPDPQDRNRPPAGMAAGKYIPELDALIRDERQSEGPSVAKYVLKSWWKNFDRIQVRATELIAATPDSDARDALTNALSDDRLAISSSEVPPIVVVPFVTDNNGALTLGTASPIVLLGSNWNQQISGGTATIQLLKELSATCTDVWIAPRALDLLGFMEDRDIPLPKKVIDPALCAFALCPDDPPQAVATCPSASDLKDDVRRWLWDVKRKEAAPSDFGALAAALPGIVRELSSQISGRGLDSLVNDDLAATLPVLSTMERRCAWTGTDSKAVWKTLQGAMTQLEAQFRDVVGDTDPYEAEPAGLLRAINRNEVLLPEEYVLNGNDAKNQLERLAHHHPGVRALIEARTLNEILLWMRRIDNGGGRLRGRHFPEVTGRFGMNAWPMQNMPKHSKWAKTMRGLLTGPPGTHLIAADFSSFELRLTAGLSRDPSLLRAAQMPDAIGFMAKEYFGTDSPSRSRAQMKDYLHPFNYGIDEWGFIESQTSVPVLEAAENFQHLRNDLKGVVEWRRQVAESLSSTGGVVRTTGGWQRNPRVAKRRGRRLENAAASTMVQGLAADILRWCLRELHQTLPSLNGELVFQAHDEVYVASEKDAVPAIITELRDVFETRVTESGLVPPDIKLFARIKTGPTWAELL